MCKSMHPVSHRHQRRPQLVSSFVAGTNGSEYSEDGARNLTSAELVRIDRR